MRFVIVTGMSGAGKSTALKMLEDMGYFCVDNLPIAMFPGFVQMIENSETSMKKVALGVDVRSGQDISGLEKDLEQMDEKGIKGKACTPFLLAKVAALTGGDSLDSNIHLVFNNAQLMAKVACEYSKM